MEQMESVIKQRILEGLLITNYKHNQLLSDACIAFYLLNNFDYTVNLLLGDFIAINEAYTNSLEYVPNKYTYVSDFFRQ
jgi:hypothetical protein